MSDETSRLTDKGSNGASSRNIARISMPPQQATGTSGP